MISRKTHGLIDYMAAGMLFALPRAAGWPRRFRDLLTAAALGTLGYSLLTRYELGLVRVLPFRQHLSLDFAQAVTLLAAPLLTFRMRPDIRRAFLGLGLFELVVTVLTERDEMTG